MPEPTATPNPADPAANPGTPAPAGGATPNPAPATPPADGGQGGSPAEPDPKTVDLRALQESRDREKVLKGEIDALKTLYGNTPPGQGPAAPSQLPTAGDNVANVGHKLEALWDEDPRKAMQTELMMAINWYDSTNTEVDVQSDAAATKYTDFDQYRTQINKYLRGLPVTERSRPGMVESAYFFIKGKGADALLTKKEEELRGRYAAGVGATGFPGGTTTVATSGGQNVQLTADELKVAEAMGITPEQYAKNKKG